MSSCLKSVCIIGYLLLSLKPIKKKDIKQVEQRLKFEYAKGIEVNIYKKNLI